MIGTVTTKDEIGDICDNHSPAASQYPSGLWVQPYWSNSDNNCVAPGIDEVDKGSSTKVTNKNDKEVFKNPKLYLIFWGQDWKDRVLDPTSSGVADLVQNKLLVTNAQYFSKLSQYDSCGIPTWGGFVYNTTTPLPTGTNIKVSQCEKAIKDSFDKGLLGIPKESDQIIYFLITPVGKGLQTDDGVTGFVGKHDVSRMTLSAPTGGGGSGGPITPPSITNFESTLKLQWHVNYDNGAQCGPGGLIPSYNVPVPDPGNDAQITNHATWKNQTRVAQKVATSSSNLRTKPIKQVLIPLKKVGTPGASPTITLKIWTGNTSNIPLEPL